LGDVDALLDGLERLIAKKRDLKQAAMQQLLTGLTRLKGFGPTKSFKPFVYGSIPDDWTTMPLSIAGTVNGRIGWHGLKQREFTGAT
jgi:type I restriction enzyme S subunit